MSIFSIGVDNSLVDGIFDSFIKDLNVVKRRSDVRDVRSGTRSAWTPSLDVRETDSEFVVNAELPGLSKDQINVDVHDDILTISGETKKDSNQEGNAYIQERRYGSFTRSISFPSGVKADDATAKFDNGLLELKLPKTAPSSGKKIEIQ